MPELSLEGTTVSQEEKLGPDAVDLERQMLAQKPETERANCVMIKQ